MVTYHGKSNGSAIPFGKHQKLWVVIWGDAVFLLFLACLADLDILCSGSFYHHVKFDSFIFMHKISSRVVCVNGKHPISPYLFWKQILKKQNIAYTKNCQEFLASQVPVLKRNKATNSSTSNLPLSGDE